LDNRNHRRFVSSKKYFFDYTGKLTPQGRLTDSE
jgi:hypothetical protein